jgi:hypothetical protein
MKQTFREEHLCSCVPLQGVEAVAQWVVFSDDARMRMNVS